MKTLLRILLLYFIAFSINLSFANSFNHSILPDEKSSKAKIPWIKNTGQFPAEIEFSSKSFLADIYIDKYRGINYLLPVDGNAPLLVKESFISSVLPTEKIIGEGKANTSINYFKNGVNFTNIPTFNSLQLGEIWDGIEVRLVSTNNNFEKIFILKPDANVEDITIKITGTKDLCITSTEELQMDLDNRAIAFTRPIAWQDINGKRKDVDVFYRIYQGTKDLFYGFELGSYNTNYPVIIDPLLSATYLGGNLLDYAKKIKVGNSGGVYVAGSTGSLDFPAVQQSYDPIHNGETDVFIALFSNDLNDLKSCTFIGGNYDDYLFDMTIDDNDNIYITGKTESPDYPTTVNAFDTSYNSSGIKSYSDIIISMFNSHLDSLIYSTFVGNDFDDFATAIDIDNQGDILITGFSENGILPVGIPQFNPITKDLIFFKMDNTLSNLLASNSISSDSTIIASDIAHDSYDNIFITGNTNGKDFPATTGAFADTLTGEVDIFVLKLNNDLNNIIAATYLGGKSIDLSSAILIDNSDNIVLTGGTLSKRFPTSQSAYDTIYANNNINPLPDAFVCILDNSLHSLKYSTFIGGHGDDAGSDISFDTLGNIFITGTTNSVDFPVFCNSFDNSYNGGEDCFVIGLNSDLTRLKASTLYGGKHNDHAYSLFIDKKNDVFVTGYTESSDLISFTSYDNSFNGGVGDGLVFKISANLDKPYPCCSQLIAPQNNSTGINRDVKLNWTSARGATGYYLSIGTNIDSLEILNHFDNGNSLEYIVTGLPCGETILIHIYPYNSNGINNNCELFKFDTREPFTEESVFDICVGDSINWRDSIYFQSGVFNDVYTDIYGCDSTYSMQLNVHQPYFKVDTASICSNESYTWNGNIYYKQGQYTIADTTIYGCDSTNQLNLIVNEIFIQKDTIRICQGEYIFWQGQNYSYPGNYIKTYTDSNGCDSTYYLKLIVNPSYLIEENTSICLGDSYFWQGNIYYTSGIFYRSYTSIFGCDSTYKLDLSVNPIYNISITPSICQGDTFFFQGTAYTETGEYMVNLQTIEGCDSTINIFLNVNLNYFTEDTITICEGDTIYFGDTAYSKAGEYTINKQTINGCDSITQLVLFVNPSILSYDTLSICNGDTIYWQGIQITEAGDYSNTGSSDCDSIVNLNVSVHPYYQFYDTISICNGDTIQWQGKFLLVPGNYTSEYQTTEGCDSSYFLTLKLEPSYYIVEETEICQNDSIIWQDTLINTPGIYFANYETINGCDSNYQLTVIQTLIDTSVIISGDTLFAVFDSNATYQWLNCPDFDIINNEDDYIYAPSVSGSYAVRIVNGGCIDTSNCHTVMSSGTFNLGKSQIVSVYPNPICKDHLFINISNYTGLFSIKINNLQGKEVISHSKFKVNEPISIDKLKAGVYIVTIDFNKIIKHIKIIILR